MKYLIEISYKGTKYSGWQKQPDVMTICEILENAICKILRQKILLYGASRTDKGVHAKQQFAHFETNEEICFKKFLNKINILLKNEDIIVKSIILIPDSFHSRYSCIKKIYKYQLFFSKYKNPFLSQTCWVIQNFLHTFDLNKAQECANFLVGQHDFASFRASSCQAQSTLRTIDAISIIRSYHDYSGDLIIIAVEGKSFLQHQIRIMVGTIISILSRDQKTSKILEILQAKNRVYAGATAPSCGLFLDKVIFSI